MDMDTFSKKAIAKTEEILKSKDLDYHIEPTSIIKVNDTIKTGFCIRRKENEAAPTLYFEDLYPRFKQGETISSIVNEVIDAFFESEELIRPEADDLNLSFDEVLPMLRVRIVDTECNEKYLQTVVHQIIPDCNLAIIPDIRWEKDTGSFTSVVTHSLAEMNKYDEAEVIRAAFEAARTCDPPKLFSLSEAVFAGYEATNLLDTSASIKPDMLVLTSQSGQFGAYAMLLPDVLDTIYKKVGSFHILPSSRHELIIVPDLMGIPEIDLIEMVQAANASVVTVDDFLSSDIFSYTPSSGLVRCRNEKLRNAS